MRAFWIQILSAMTVVAGALLFVAPAQAACGFGRQEIVGQLPDLFFQPGVPSQRTISYRYKSLDLSGGDCGIYIRSRTSGLSSISTYGGDPIAPPGTWTGAGPATFIGAEKAWTLQVSFDGSAPAGTKGAVDVAVNEACDVCVPSYRVIGVINVYVDATASATWFRATADASNTYGHRFTLEHPYLTGNPKAVLFASHVWNPNDGTTQYDPHPTSVRFDSALKRWTIQHDDLAPMLPNTGFNVRIDPNANTYTAVSGSNILWSLMFVRHPVADNNPNAVLMVTPVDAGVKNPHPTAVRYVGNVWAIWNADGASMPPGARFNVKVMGYAEYLSESAGNSGSSASKGVAVDMDGASRTTGNSRREELWWLNNNRATYAIITASYNPLNRSAGITHAHYTGTWYNTWTNRWNIYSEDSAAMPGDAAFNIWAKLPLELIPLPVATATLAQ